MVALSVLFVLVGCGSSVRWELLKGDCVPNGEEVWYDGVDQDCDGASDFDQDGDGFESANDPQADGSVGDDCVDGSENDEVFTDSCSGALVTVAPADAASVNPDAEDALYDGVDQNCDGADDNDGDGDGYAVCEECDDTDAAMFPNDNIEVYYDCVDQNCDGNDGDRDGDGYVDAQYTASCPGWATINPGRLDNDCDDDDSTISPAAEEGVGDGNDQNCDSSENCYDDDDDDGYRDDAGSVIASADIDCTDPGEATASDPTGDCDDKNGAINPGATELCDALNADENCDGKADNDDPASTGITRYYKDADGDTYGDASDSGALQCDTDSTYKATNNTDCDDSASSINTAATDICDNGADDDCDGVAPLCKLSGVFTDVDADLTIQGMSDTYGVGISFESGDMNGDGISDLLIGAPYTDTSTLINVGAAYVLYGPITASTTLPTGADLTLNGATAAELTGYEVSACGDANGDGIDDLLISILAYDPGGPSNAGGGALLYGSSGAGRSGTFTPTSVDALWQGENSQDGVGNSVQFVGDLNGDGADEFALGGYGLDDNGSSSGGVYLVLGSSSPYSGIFDLADEATLIKGESAGDYLGYQASVSDPIDLDDDGVFDLVLGAFLRDSNGTISGSLYVAYDIGVSLLPGTEWDINDVYDAELVGDTSGGYLGQVVARAGDVDGDGSEDLVVAEKLSDTADGINVGCVWVLSGGGPRYSGKIDNSTYAFVSFCGAGASDFVGGLAFGGDINGDAYADVVVGAAGIDSGSYSDAGAAFVFFGPISSGSYLTSDAEATITGNNSDEYRASAGAILDIDNDGDNDLLIGAYSGAENGDNNIIVFSGSDY